MEGLAPPFRRNVGDFCGQALIYIGLRAFLRTTRFCSWRAHLRKKTCPRSYWMGVGLEPKLWAAAQEPLVHGT